MVAHSNSKSMNVLLQKTSLSFCRTDIWRIQKQEPQAPKELKRIVT